MLCADFCFNRRGFVIVVGTLGSLFADDGAVLKSAHRALVYGLRVVADAAECSHRGFYGGHL